MIQAACMTQDAGGCDARRPTIMVNTTATANARLLIVFEADRAAYA